MLHFIKGCDDTPVLNLYRYKDGLYNYINKQEHLFIEQFTNWTKGHIATCKSVSVWTNVNMTFQNHQWSPLF